jgi:hypothetical protein
MRDLLPLAVVALLAALVVWRRRRRDDLMALAHATRPHCTHIGRASELNHLWHECDLHPRHTDVDPMHHCARGAYWRRAAHETSQIQALDALYADASEPDRRH